MEGVQNIINRVFETVKQMFRVMFEKKQEEKHSNEEQQRAAQVINELDALFG